MGQIADYIGWMAWTWQTMIFFGSLVVILVVMTLLAVYRPETPHVGMLRFATTRSDRLFVSLLSSAFIFLFFMRFGGENLILPLVGSLIWSAVLFRFA